MARVLVYRPIAGSERGLVPLFVPCSISTSTATTFRYVTAIFRSAVPSLSQKESTSSPPIPCLLLVTERIAFGSNIQFWAHLKMSKWVSKFCISKWKKKSSKLKWPFCTIFSAHEIMSGVNRKYSWSRILGTKLIDQFVTIVSSSKPVSDTINLR